MNQQQAHRSKKLSGYYERQFQVTLANKSRRAARRQRRKVDVLRRQMLKRLPSNETHRHAGNHHARVGHQNA